MRNDTFRLARRQRREDDVFRMARIALVVLALALFLFFLVTAIVPPKAHAAEKDDPNKWTTLDTSLQVATLALLVVDYGQTSFIARNPVEFTPDGDFYRDVNGRPSGTYVRHEETGWARTVIGPHPSTGSVNAYFAAAAVIHTTVAVILPKPWRTVWQCVWIGAEVGAINTNIQAGIKLKF